MHALFANREKFLPQRRQSRFFVRAWQVFQLQLIEDDDAMAAFGPIAGARRIVKSTEEFGVRFTENFNEFVPRPDVELAFLAFAVGIERGAEAAACHFAFEPADRFISPLLEEIVAEGAPGEREQFDESAHCRKAFSRNAGRATGHQSNSVHSRRRDDRRYRPPTFW